jgi:predicted metalloprotease with PDZ domain
LLDEKKMWAELVAGMPQGLPGPNDRGLDGNGEWGRVYWGGALYFLQADVEIRRRTRGAQSLESAVRAVIASGENAEHVWPLARVLAVADAVTGTGVLREQYEKMGLAPGTVDLDDLWKRLGVIAHEGTVRFDEGAPYASIRKSMVTAVGAH